jgi:hypothetical protein
MNLLDENVREDQRGLLLRWGIPAHQLGVDVGRKGMKDQEIIPFLHTLRDTTFFTRDRGFYDRRLCHPRYCLVCLTVGKEEVAVFMRRLLRHPEADTRAKRMGAVIRVSHAGFSIWRRNVAKELWICW